MKMVNHNVKKNYLVLLTLILRISMLFLGCNLESSFSDMLFIFGMIFIFTGILEHAFLPELKSKSTKLYIFK